MAWEIIFCFNAYLTLYPVNINHWICFSYPPLCIPTPHDLKKKLPIITVPQNQALSLQLLWFNFSTESKKKTGIVHMHLYRVKQRARSATLHFKVMWRQFETIYAILRVLNTNAGNNWEWILQEKSIIIERLRFATCTCTVKLEWESHKYLAYYFINFCHYKRCQTGRMYDKN